MATFNKPLVLTDGTTPRTFTPHVNNSDVSVYRSPSPAAIAANAASLTTQSSSSSKGAISRTVNMTIPTIRTIEGIETSVGASFLNLRTRFDELATIEEKELALDHLINLVQTDPDFRAAILKGEGLF